MMNASATHLSDVQNPTGRGSDDGELLARCYNHVLGHIGCDARTVRSGSW
jgi:hypothetical protein